MREKDISWRWHNKRLFVIYTYRHDSYCWSLGSQLLFTNNGAKSIELSLRFAKNLINIKFGLRYKANEQNNYLSL